jgi:hypothetical protein
MKREKIREDHSVKVTQCRRKPCRAVRRPPAEAEELLSQGAAHAGKGTRIASRASRELECSHTEKSLEPIDLLPRGE